MNPSKRSEFIRLTIVLLFVRIGDGISTYLASPDLKHELNPIVYLFGFGWIGLFVANIFCIVAIIYLNYFQLAVYNQPAFDHLRISNSRQFLSMLYYDRPDKFYWTFYRLPKRWKPFLNHIGFVFPRIMIFGGVIVIANNLLLGYQFLPYVRIMSLWEYSWIFLYILAILYAIPIYIKKVRLEYIWTITQTR